MASCSPEKLRTMSSVETNEPPEPVSGYGYGKIYLACISAYLFILTMGMTVSYTAPATMDMRKPGSRMQHITEDDITWMGSLTLLGGIPANALGGYFTHRYGRKTALMLTSILFTSSWLMIAYSSSVAWICAGRIISGFCTGLYVVAIPAYVAEIAPQDIRGMLSSGLPFFNNLGILLVMSLGLVLRWSWLAISVVILTVFSAFMMAFMPESPVWLVRESRLYEAANGLKFLHGKRSNYNAEIEKIMEVIRSEKQNKPLTLQDFRNPILYKPLLISIALFFFLPTSGFGPIITYTVEIFQRAGSTIDPNLAATILAAVQIFASVACGVVIDNFGRRKLYILSGAGTSFMLICLGIYSYILEYHPVRNSVMGYVPILCFSAYLFIFTFGIGSIPFVMIPEMISVQYRSTVLSISTVCLSIFGFAVSKSFDSLRDVLGDYGMYWFFASFTFLSVVFSYFVLPETKQLSFEEISRYFLKSHK
ncbi:facilitated trehalose transporter Tret1 [Parasteatoda tepidariorum]|uniref:facilitated trehalose transporter Tret1 n=1 Tax=Parasteatoda tepidariorum TaxID=114398 RepID=UPI00077F9B41|nr:facilitated trehalose transporter Tret1 [Parasteatoda tepidariorum]